MKCFYGTTLALFFSLAGNLAASEVPLIDAVEHQDVQRVQTLLRRGVDVNQQQELDGSTALHQAAYVDDAGILAALLKQGAKPNVANQLGITPLMLACDTRDPKVVDLLLIAGADPNARSGGGETPVLRAARVGNAEVMKLLLAHGGDANAKEPSQDQTALMWATSERHADVARLLVEHGADVKARTKPPARRTMAYPGRNSAPANAAGGNAAGPYMRQAGGNGVTALLLAARVGDVESAKVLIEAGADINDTDADKLSALTLAAVRGNVPVALYLLDHGANPNLDGAGFSALHWATGSWETELVVRSITPDRLGSVWQTIAGLRGPAKLELVKALLAHGADPNAHMTKGPFRVGQSKSPDRPELLGATPLILAAVSGDVAVMRALVAAGADPHLTTKENGTVLMAAAGLGKVQGEDLVRDSDALEAAKLAMELEGDVRAVDAAGNTALHYAAYMRHDPVVQYLVDRDAPLQAKNKFGETPLWDAELVVQFFAGGTFRLIPSSTGDLLRKLGAKAVEPSYVSGGARPRDWPDIAVIGSENEGGREKPPKPAEPVNK